MAFDRRGRAFGFNPFSLLLDNGPKSQADNNLDPPTNQTANGDSSRAGAVGQFLRISWHQQRDLCGTMTAGRMVSLSNEVATAYDPTRSNAFSLIGNTGPFPPLWVPRACPRSATPAFNIGWSTATFQWLGLAQVGNGYALGNGSMGEYRRPDRRHARRLPRRRGGSICAKDAVALARLQRKRVSAGWVQIPLRSCRATLANITTVVVAAKYKWNKAEIYGGYSYCPAGQSVRTHSPERLRHDRERHFRSTRRNERHLLRRQSDL